MRYRIQPETGIPGGPRMTTATTPPIRLVMDDYQPAAKARESQKAAPSEPTATPAKVPQNNDTKVQPAPQPVVNAEPQALTEFLLSLSPERQKEVKKYSNLPASELEVPNQERSSAILTAFHKKYAKVPAGTRNTTLFYYACTLRRCGLDEPMILTNLWQFSREHCKPPHKQNNREDVAELASLASRAARFVRPGFPAEKVKEPRADRVDTKPITTGPAPANPAPEIAEAAQKIYESGEFIDYCRENFAKIWLGDQ